MNVAQKNFCPSAGIGFLNFFNAPNNRLHKLRDWAIIEQPVEPFTEFTILRGDRATGGMASIGCASERKEVFGGSRVAEEPKFKLIDFIVVYIVRIRWRSHDQVN